MKKVIIILIFVGLYCGIMIISLINLLGPDGSDLDYAESVALELMKEYTDDLQASALLVGEDYENILKSFKIEEAYIIANTDVGNEGTGRVFVKWSYYIAGKTEVDYYSASYSNKGKKLFYMGSISMDEFNDSKGWVGDLPYDYESVDEGVVNYSYKKYLRNGE